MILRFRNIVRIDRKAVFVGQNICGCRFSRKLYCIVTSGTCVG